MNNATYLGSFTVLPRPQKNAKTQNWGLQYQDMMSTPISGISRRNGSALMSGEYSVYIKEFQPADSEIPRVEISCICSKHDENYQNERVFDNPDDLNWDMLDDLRCTSGIFGIVERQLFWSTSHDDWQNFVSSTIQHHIPSDDTATDTLMDMFFSVPSIAKNVIVTDKGVLILNCPEIVRVYLGDGPRKISGLKIRF